MRLSYLFASILPLSALAAPTVVVRQSDLDTARQEVVDGLTNAAKALNATLIEFLAIHPPHQVLIDDTLQALGNITFAGAAVQHIGDALLHGTMPLESDQLHVAEGILTAQTLINKLEGEINHGKQNKNGNSKPNGNGNGKPNGKYDLRKNIDQARDGIALALKGGIAVLQLQGKSVRELFEDAKLPVPPGF